MQAAIALELALRPSAKRSAVARTHALTKAVSLANAVKDEQSESIKKNQISQDDQSSQDVELVERLQLLLGEADVYLRKDAEEQVISSPALHQIYDQM